MWGKIIRFIAHRRGFGVHSPFAFNLITKVIEERCPYYCFQTIEVVRKQLLQSEREIRLAPGQPPQTVGRAARRGEIPARHGQLAFRLANYFQPKRVLQIGTGLGISTLYLTSYASDLQCIALERNPAFREWVRWCLAKAGRSTVDLRTGEYRELLPGVLQDLGTADFVFIHAPEAAGDLLPIFDLCVNHIQPESVFLIEGIRAGREMREAWEAIKARQEVAVTFDMYDVGLVCFNKRLHRKDYLVYL